MDLVRSVHFELLKWQNVNQTSQYVFFDIVFFDIILDEFHN